MEFDRDAITSVMDEIWQAVLGLDLGDEPSATTGETLTGCVHISGDWSGSVTLEVPSALARRTAALMFGMGEAELTGPELEDALGELTNMTGGGVKAMVPGSCALSLPTVVGGVAYTVTLPGSRVVHSIARSCEGDSVVVKVFERGEASRPSDVEVQECAS